MNAPQVMTIVWPDSAQEPIIMSSGLKSPGPTSSTAFYEYDIHFLEETLKHLKQKGQQLRRESDQYHQKI